MPWLQRLDMPGGWDSDPSNIIHLRGQLAEPLDGMPRWIWLRRSRTSAIEKLGGRTPATLGCSARSEGEQEDVAAELSRSVADPTIVEFGSLEDVHGGVLLVFKPHLSPADTRPRTLLVLMRLGRRHG